MTRKPPPPAPRKLPPLAIQFARKCIAMRRKYPSLRELARQWGVDEASVRRAVKGPDRERLPVDLTVD